MGGLDAGEVASRLSVEGVIETLSKATIPLDNLNARCELLHKAFSQAHKK